MNAVTTNGERFDDLTRLLARGTSWRTVWRDLTATMMARPVALFSTGSGFATSGGGLPSMGGLVPDKHCRPILAHCHDFKQCCSGLCLDILKICL